MKTFPILGGKLVLEDIAPRPTEDPLWLAATMPPLPAGSRVLDAGSGSGIAGLALLARSPHLVLENIDINSEYRRLSDINAAHNGYTVISHIGDILKSPQIGPFDAILCNPPYHAEERGHTTPDPDKAQAHTLPTGHLTLWLQSLTTLLTPTGLLHLILHSACEAELTEFSIKNHYLDIQHLLTSPHRPAKRLLATLRPSATPTVTLKPALEAFNPEIRAQALT